MPNSFSPLCRFIVSLCISGIEEKIEKIEKRRGEKRREEKRREEKRREDREEKIEKRREDREDREDREEKRREEKRREEKRREEKRRRTIFVREETDGEFGELGDEMFGRVFGGIEEGFVGSLKESTLKGTCREKDLIDRVAIARVAQILQSDESRSRFLFKRRSSLAQLSKLKAERFRWNKESISQSVSRSNNGSSAI